MAKEYSKTWTGVDGNDREARVWIDEKDHRLCWEVKTIPADTSEEEATILTALGKGSEAAKVSATPQTSGGSQGGSIPFETDEELGLAIKTLMESMQG